jgi:hypothetical protein
MKKELIIFYKEYVKEINTFNDNLYKESSQYYGEIIEPIKISFEGFMNWLETGSIL